MTQDEDQLRLLSIFHYVLGGILGVCSLFPLIHVTIGLMFIFNPQGFTSHGEAPPAFLGWMFVILGGLAVLCGLTLAICILNAGRFLSRRSHYMFCLVIAALECIFMPLGTALGVFSIVVLTRDSVKQLFGVQRPA